MSRRAMVEWRHFVRVIGSVEYAVIASVDYNGGCTIWQFWPLSLGVVVEKKKKKKVHHTAPHGEAKKGMWCTPLSNVPRQIRRPVAVQIRDHGSARSPYLPRQRVWRWLASGACLAYPLARCAAPDLRLIWPLAAGFATPRPCARLRLHARVHALRGERLKNNC